VRNRHKVKTVRVALFFHVLEQLHKVSFFVCGDPSANGGSVEVAVIGLCVLHGFPYL